jgi:hypothetical protein
MISAQDIVWKEHLLTYKKVWDLYKLDPKHRGHKRIGKKTRTRGNEIDLGQWIDKQIFQWVAFDSGKKDAQITPWRIEQLKNILNIQSYKDLGYRSVEDRDTEWAKKLDDYIQALKKYRKQVGDSKVIRIPQGSKIKMRGINMADWIRDEIICWAKLQTGESSPGTNLKRVELLKAKLGINTPQAAGYKAIDPDQEWLSNLKAYKQCWDVYPKKTGAYKIPCDSEVVGNGIKMGPWIDRQLVYWVAYEMGDQKNINLWRIEKLKKILKIQTPKDLGNKTQKERNEEWLERLHDYKKAFDSYVLLTENKGVKKIKKTAGIRVGGVDMGLWIRAQVEEWAATERKEKNPPMDPWRISKLKEVLNISTLQDLGYQTPNDKNQVWLKKLYTYKQAFDAYLKIPGNESKKRIPLKAKILAEQGWDLGIWIADQMKHWNKFLKNDPSAEMDLWRVKNMKKVLDVETLEDLGFKSEECLEEEWEKTLKDYLTQMKETQLWKGCGKIRLPKGARVNGKMAELWIEDQIQCWKDWNPKQRETRITPERIKKLQQAFHVKTAEELNALYRIRGKFFPKEHGSAINAKKP